ncbi:MAG TPA: hypothetical protein VMH33_04405 [Solirubrobacterales bacterium]|nr:hypothetical protein [Solirubrobacterales bacterium]
MAQPKNKRRRKRRGTQGGRIDTKGRRPRTRDEARSRARSGGSRSTAKKQDLPPTWKGSAMRGLAAAGIFIFILIILFKRPFGVSLLFGLFMMAFYIPTGYYIDGVMWRRRERQRIRDREGT